LAISEKGELYRLTHTHLFELISQIRHTPHCLTIRADDNIAKGSSAGIDTTEASARSRRAGDSAHNRNPLNAHSGSHRFVSSDDSNSRSRYMTIADQLRHHSVHDVDWDRKSDACIRPRRRNDRGIDTDHMATGIEQGASRVAGIHGRIGLNDIRDFVRWSADAA
jgi:hypothetical protein